MNISALQKCNLFLRTKFVALIIMTLFILIPLISYILLTKSLIVEPLPIGSNIPIDSIALFANNQNDLEALTRRGYILIFASPTCEHCHIVLNNFIKIKAGMNITIFAIFSAPNKSLPGLKEQYDLNIICDENGILRKIFKVIAVPTIFFMNKNNVLIHRQTGRRSFIHDSSFVNRFVENNLVSR